MRTAPAAACSPRSSNPTGSLEAATEDPSLRALTGGSPMTSDTPRVRGRYLQSGCDVDRIADQHQRYALRAADIVQDRRSLVEADGQRRLSVACTLAVPLGKPAEHGVGACEDIP